MRVKFVLKNQNDVDILTKMVLDEIGESGLEIVVGFSGRSKKRLKDVGLFDFVKDNDKYGAFEYRLQDGVYHIVLDMVIPQVYDEVKNKISKLYPYIFEPVNN